MPSPESELMIQNASTEGLRSTRNVICRERDSMDGETCVPISPAVDDDHNNAATTTTERRCHVITTTTLPRFEKASILT